MAYKDYLVRALAADEQIRAFAVTTKDTVEFARKAHNLSPIAGAALGRTMSAALMMGDMLKNKEDVLTIQINGNGPLKGLTTVSNNQGEVRGYVKNPSVILPPEKNGHLNVGGGIGQGTLTVIRDLGLKEPYVSTIPLHSGEIADDFTYYFAQSEQTPSSVGLGVLFDKNTVEVSCAGGFIVQLMPNCDSKVIDKLEENLKKFPGVTEILKDGKTPEELLKVVLDGFDIQFLGTQDVGFKCNCSYQRGENILASLGAKELDDIISKNEPVDLECAFCGKKYHYDIDAVKKIRTGLDDNKGENKESA